MTQDRKRGRRPGRGTLAIIAVLLLGSALLRVGLQATEAIAREASPEELAESLPMPAPLAAPQQCVNDPDLVPLLEAMETREDRLRMREERMTMRMRALQVADARIQEKLAELRASEAALRATIALADEAAESDLSRLTSVYENMKPKDAAALFETMDPDFAAGFLGRMRPEAAAGIMTGLSPETAYLVSVVLAGRNAEVPRE
ncbi:hypothetical protein MALG_03612 [Marinovum algicola DG 898]|nr:hypothetical protein MALG_03612 [Marinovum algicola DG 898]